MKTVAPPALRGPASFLFEDLSDGGPSSPTKRGVAMPANDFTDIEVSLTLLGTSDHATAEFHANAAEYVEDLLEEVSTYGAALEELEEKKAALEADLAEAREEAEQLATACQRLTRAMRADPAVRDAVLGEDEEHAAATIEAVLLGPLWDLLGEARRRAEHHAVYVARARDQLTRVFSSARYTKAELVERAAKHAIDVTGMTKAKLAGAIAEREVA